VPPLTITDHVFITTVEVFLVFTIYLQSVLGYSAIKAGLTLLPSSVVSVIVA
jgi:hypothetical protein